MPLSNARNAERMRQHRAAAAAAAAASPPDRVPRPRGRIPRDHEWDATPTGCYRHVDTAPAHQPRTARHHLRPASAAPATAACQGNPLGRALATRNGVRAKVASDMLRRRVRGVPGAVDHGGGGERGGRGLGRRRQGRGVGRLGRRRGRGGTIGQEVSVLGNDN